MHRRVLRFVATRACCLPSAAIPISTLTMPRGPGSGIRCSSDPCDPNPCDHEGTCASGDGVNIVCTCPITYTDATCETPVDPCQSNPCEAGTCTNNDPPTTYSCECFNGYRGSDCDVDVCAVDAPCLNGGSCIGEDRPIPLYSCHCAAGYTGYTCNTEVCASSPCQVTAISLAIPAPFSFPGVLGASPGIAMLCSFVFSARRFLQPCRGPLAESSCPGIHVLLRCGVDGTRVWHGYLCPLARSTPSVSERRRVWGDVRHRVSLCMQQPPLHRGPLRNDSRCLRV